MPFKSEQNCVVYNKYHFFVKNFTVIKEHKTVDPLIAVIHCLSIVISDVAVSLSWLPLDCESVYITI